MSFLVDVGLPLGLAFMMFSLGLGLSAGDFLRVLRRPRAVLTGAIAQLVLLPLTALALVTLAGLDPVLSVGVMILAFSPGGVTTNMMTRIAQGDVALSVTLTAVISMAAVFTVPPLVSLAAAHFIGDALPPVAIAPLALTMALITALPVALAMVLRRAAPAFVARIEPRAFVVSAMVFAAIVVAALVQNWALFLSELDVLGPLMVAMILLLLALGFGLARAAGLGRAEARAIAIETGVQNGALGITVAGLAAGSVPGMDALLLPSAVYGILTYVIVVPLILLLNRRPVMPGS
jgi:BASS family bile acid:Na+ symporter